MIEYILAKEEDYIDINNFYNRLHKSNRTIEQFKWEFHKGPVDKSIYIIAKDTIKNTVIGSQAVILINLIDSKGNIILSGKSEDTLVDPEYRGKNIFKNMYEMLFNECTKNGVNYIWGFTTAKKPFAKMNFDIPWSHSQSLLVNQVLPSAKYLISLNQNNRLLDKLKIFGLSIKSKLNKIVINGKKEFEGYSISEEQAINVIDLVNKIIKYSGSDSFAIYQDDEYQKWRFYENPNFKKVNSFVLKKDNKIFGAFISNANQQNVAYISQFIIDPNIPEKIKINFINYCSRRLFNNGIILIRNWNFSHTKYNTMEVNDFKSSGYTYLNRGVPFVWKTQINKNLSASDFIMWRIASEGTV